MALFIVACGILLMLGGAVSLLLGFDIVLTERGAAMTIGGVVALSGGVIALGIGLALKRLRQILAVLEAGAAKPMRSAAPDRPVLPIAAEETRPDAASAAGEPADAALPPRAAPGPAPAAASGSLLPGLAVAGVSGAAAIGAASAFSRDRSEDGSAPSLPEAASPPPVPSWAPEPDRADAASDSPPPAAPLSLPVDLEEELSRALAETTVPSDVGAIASEPEAAGRSFEDGLSELLGRTSSTGAESTRQQDLADLLGAPEPAIEEPPVGEPEALLLDDAAQPADAELAAEATALEIEPDVPAEDWREERQEPAPEPEAALEAPPTAPLAQVDDDIFADMQQAADVANRALDEAFAEHSGVPAEYPSGNPAGIPVEAAAPATPVLGTYTIGGRTYRMFGDGSVEAVSEKGEIERFSSMDALRRHLARV